MKLPSLLSLVTALAPLALTMFTPASFAQAGGQAATHQFGQSRPIAGRYIVVLKDTVGNPAAEAASLVRSAGGQLHHTYASAIKGFAASLPDAALQGIRNNPNVNYIEQDQTVSLNQVASPQQQATWGLDRIDQADLPLDTQYHFNGTGAGVTAFIIDTGIRADHVEFTGRVKPGIGFVADGNGTNDCNGHGTHVAGTVGGTTWGVAKGAALVPVRVLDCAGSGSWSNVIAGLDWVANHAARPAVANLSLGGAASTSVDTAVNGAITKGVAVVVAAGNNNADACTVSPARVPAAVTVGATTTLDYRASYSNVGACMDLFAPGHGITSAWNTGATASQALSGTSMAAPHVAGVAALMLQASPTATPAAVAAQLVANATPNRVQYAGTGSPNLLLSAGATSAPVVQPAIRTVAVQSLAGAATRSGGNWRAVVTVTVRDVATGNRVAGATATGSFAPGGAANCVTDANGTCTLSGGPFKLNATASTALTIGTLSGSSLTYDASQNTASQVMVGRP
jgi:subtilisin family serine protease